MTTTEIVSMLKLDLQNPPDAMDDYLTFLVNSATSQIGDKGITLDLTAVDDCHLVVMYASWLYRKRNSNEAMPRMLQYSLHSRLIHEKGDTSEEDDDA